MKQLTIATSMTAQAWDNQAQRLLRFYLHPATENNGIIFRRIDLAHRPEFCLTAESLRELLPDLEAEYFSLTTFLPLLAVLRALDIDNITIDCESGFMPKMGESASVLMFIVQSAGIKQQNAMKKYMNLLAPVTYKSESGAWAKLMPGEKKRMAIMSSPFSDAQLGAGKNIVVDCTKAFFASELCHVRSEALIDIDLQALTGSNTSPEVKQNLLARLSKEKSYVQLFDTYSILSLLPWPLKADYIGFNASKKENIGLLTQLLGSDSFNLKTDLSVAGSESVEEKQNNVAM